MFGINRHCLAAIATTLVSLTAAAGESENAIDTPPSMTVKYGDLDLTTQQGISTLYHRLSIAAERVCPAVDNQNLSALRHARACQSEAIERAVRSIGNPMLANLQNRGSLNR